MASLTHKILAANGHGRDMFGRQATAILLPTSGPPRTVKVTVAPATSEQQRQDEQAVESFIAMSSSYLQGNTMTLLSGEPGCSDFALLRQGTHARFPAQLRGPCPLNVSDLPPGGWAGIIDSKTTWVSSDLLLDIFFLGGDNGFPLGVILTERLPLNANLDNKVYGPVLVFAGRAVEVEGMEHQAMFDFPDEILEDTAATQEICAEVKAGVAQRYADANVLQP